MRFSYKQFWLMTLVLLIFVTPIALAFEIGRALGSREERTVTILQIRRDAPLDLLSEMAAKKQRGESYNDMGFQIPGEQVHPEDSK